jgi:hypothetical protein
VTKTILNARQTSKTVKILITTKRKSSLKFKTN